VFVPLRVHSVFSKGKGSVLVEEAAAWAAGKKLPAAALADVGNLYSWNRWRRAARERGVVPIFGCEVETRRGRLLLLVKTRAGYGNLVEALNRREAGSGDGLVTIIIPDPKGSGPDGAGAAEEAGPGGEPGDLYIGAGFGNFKAALDLSRRSGRPLVWANPLKYVASAERLILLHAIEKKLPYPPEWERLKTKVRLYGPDQEAPALKRFGAAAGDALLRTFEVAEKCRFAFEDIVPPLPADLFPRSLRETVVDRLTAAKALSWRERERARHELDVVEASGFAPYFLIVHDVVEFARRRGILHNLRGSGASSFLAFLLGISHVNPIDFDLYFERFLNRGRPEPPDIDIDFDSRRRDEVLAYVLERYGRGRTGAACVSSVKSFGARSALYETARALGVAPEEARSLAKRAPVFAEPASLRGAAPAPGFLEIWQLAAELDGAYAESSLHVGGVILTPAPVERFLPLATSAKGLLMCHFDKDAVEDLRLIKLDLLSVRGLAAVSETKEKLRLRSFPEDDAKTWSLVSQARTIGCFQVESPAMMNLLRRMRPRSIPELTQALALIRPGPTESGMKEAFLKSREGRGEGRDPLLAKVLPETDGLLLYEEQVMQVAERVAGFPAETGDLLRRGLKRKGGDPDLRVRFVREARGRGYTGAEVERLWTVMERFSSYSFNKAHSASYAHMAYQAAYLKAHHPLPYLAAVLNAGGGYYGLEEYVEEAKRQGIRILGPDANRSREGFEVEGDGIRVGLTAIKGLGLKTVEAALRERDGGGPFGSVEDFLARVRPGKAELLALVRAGVFDSLEPRRTRQILRYVQGLEDMEEVADLDAREKDRMLAASLGFSPGADPLEFFEGKRPGLRIRDLPDRVGRTVELVVRVVDAREKRVNGGRASKYFYLFEDETGLLEGVGEKRLLAFGTPPACCLRGEVRSDGAGRVKILDCSFLRSF
jgi:DNA-directed DNA polymerase III PolC